jgi:transposase-like protein
VAEWLAERGIHVDASTIYDWVRTFTPCFIEAARVHRSLVAHRWRVDETYLKVGTSWHYLYRAIDEHGQIVDVYLSDRRNAAAAQAFFKAAIAASGASPTQVTTGYPLGEAKCYPPALRTLLPHVDHRSSKYLNNGLERDHQHLNGRIRPMRSFKTVGGASTFSRGHAVVRNLRRGFSTLTAAVAVPLRLVTAWTALAATL